MRRILPLLPVVLLMLLAPAAHANGSQESIFQDDKRLIGSGDVVRQRTLNELQSLGVTTLRVNIIWAYFSKSPWSKRKPRGLTLANPASYPLYEYDALAAEARARGMSLILTPTGPLPAWASRCGGTPRARRVCNPRTSEWKAFMTALGRRFPTVHRWSIWNEPNYGGWLRPQWVKVGGSYYPQSARVYRGLVRTAIAALHATGHQHDQILVGENGPTGRNSGKWLSRSNHPAEFYRDLFCLDDGGHKLGGYRARILGCTHFKRLAIGGIAVHPYTQGASRNPYVRVGPTDATLVHLNRIVAWVNRAARQGRIPHGLKLYDTEYGFQTNPPDRFGGVSLGTQAKWLNMSDYLSWRNGRLASTSQYLLRDDPGLNAFQTGLRFKNGRAKPSYGAYRLPIWPVSTRRGTSVWLQVRPLGTLGLAGGPYSDALQRVVTVQYRRGRRGKFHTYRSVTVRNRRGFLYLRTGVRAAYWRFTWNGKYSRTAAVG